MRGGGLEGNGGRGGLGMEGADGKGKRKDAWTVKVKRCKDKWKGSV